MEQTRDRNIIQIYFKEINNVYKKNNNDYNIEYCAENRDKLISMNLKSVIYIAKKYVGLGVELEDLISAGNLGLCTAWEKFDPSRNTLKQQVLELLDTKEDTVNYDDMSDIFELISYGDLGAKFATEFPEAHSYSKSKLRAWINKNVSSAKFNSIAAMWIRAYILLEIDNNSRLVKKPKSEIYKDKQKTNSYSTEISVELSGIERDEEYEYYDENSQELHDAYHQFKGNLNRLLDGIGSRDRSIILKKFGIGLPRPMEPKEIAEQEGLSIARISQIVQSVLTKMKSNCVKYNISSKSMYEDLECMML